MSILTYPLGFIGGGKEDFYNGVMENSIRTEAHSVDTTSYLYRTPSDAGDSRTFTISVWIKWWECGNTTAYGSGYGLNPWLTVGSGTDHFDLMFGPTGQLKLLTRTGGSYVGEWYSAESYRDPMALSLIHI